MKHVRDAAAHAAWPYGTSKESPHEFVTSVRPGGRVVLGYAALGFGEAQRVAEWLVYVNLASHRTV